MAARRARPALSAILRTLAELHGPPPRPLPRTPLQWILWENVAYLVDDARRRKAFEALRASVGLTAEALGRARREDLLAVTRLGGMHPEARADRLAEIGALARANGGKGLESVLRLEPAAARRVLGKFPGIGKPGAEKILMACGASGALALESNGLRVLLRLGYGKEGKSYPATYRSVQEALEPEREDDPAWALRAHQLLRTHGQTLCKNRAPDCDACALAESCPSVS